MRPPRAATRPATSSESPETPRSASHPTLARRVRRTVAVAAVTALAVSALAATRLDPAPGTSAPTVAPTAELAAAAARAAKPNPVTPGNFTGFGFDQCEAPSQRTMDTWLQHSPFLAAGIYISGDSRACRAQTNLTPTWIRTQLAKGWRLLPITLGPQASCQPRFPRYSDDFTINPDRGGGKYGKARTMGQNSATSTVRDAKALGLTPGSTLWYDLEGFDTRNTACRESALSFLSAWTTRVEALGFVAGVYSSAGSGLNAIDDARVSRPGAFNLPTRIWFARWDGVANTSTSYLREDGWRPGNRVKQYRGGHDEVWGGARINIDSNFLDLGRTVAGPERHCDGTRISFPSYPSLRPASGSYTPSAGHVKALQCLLKERGLYSGAIHGVYGRSVVAAAGKWQTRSGGKATARWFGRDWITLLSAGYRPALKRGSAGVYVRRVQRALNAAQLGSTVPVTGVFDSRTDGQVRIYQRRVGVAASGVVNDATWARLRAGKRR